MLDADLPPFQLSLDVGLGNHVVAPCWFAQHARLDGLPILCQELAEQESLIHSPRRWDGGKAKRAPPPLRGNRAALEPFRAEV
jgi:hypothetical protein